MHKLILEVGHLVSMDRVGLSHVIIEPVTSAGGPQRKHAKEFRDRTFGCTFFMLLKRCTFIKKSEMSYSGIVIQGGKSCISAAKTAAFGANKISPTSLLRNHPSRD